MDAKRRAHLFWGVCIPLRAWLSTRGDVSTLRWFALVVGGRWMVGLENGDEGMFGGPAWWADERRQHGALWLGYALSGESAFLKADTAFGVVNWARTFLLKED